MRLLLSILAALSISLAVSSASALSVTCLPPALPATPIPPVFTLDVVSFSGQAHIDLRRQPNVDGSGQTAVLLRVTPTSGLCPSASSS
jgi:hypothetical protein